MYFNSNNFQPLQKQIIMKKVLFVILLIVTNIITLVLATPKTDVSQATKDYEVACILSDIVRNTIDNLGTEAEEIYHEYVDNLDTMGTLHITEEDIESMRYCWCY